MDDVIKSTKIKINDLHIILEYLDGGNIFVYVTEDNSRKEFAGRIKRI